MARSKITLFNAAMAKAGHSRQLIEGDTAPAFFVLDTNYPEIVGEAFESSRLHFGKIRATLTTRSDGDFGFDNRYLLPNDFLSAIRVEVDDALPRDWEINGDHLYLHAETGVVLEYIRQGAESMWSSTFANAIIYLLAALIKESVNEEVEEAQALETAGENKLMKAGILSSKQRKDRRPYKEGFLMRSRRRGQQRYRNRGPT